MWDGKRRRDIRSRGGRIIAAPGLQRGDPDGSTRDRDREDDTKPLEASVGAGN